MENKAVVIDRDISYNKFDLLVFFCFRIGTYVGNGKIIFLGIPHFIQMHFLSIVSCARSSFVIYLFILESIPPFTQACLTLRPYLSFCLSTFIKNLQYYNIIFCFQIIYLVFNLVVWILEYLCKSTNKISIREVWNYMKCPVCKNIFLEKTSLLDELYAYSCKSCGGNWMRYEDYWKCHESNPNPANKPLDIKTHLPVNDIIQAKICPDCGRILIKYRVTTVWILCGALRQL